MTSDHKFLKLLTVAMVISAGVLVYVATTPPGAFYKTVVKMFDWDGTDDGPRRKSYLILDVRNPLLSPLAWEGSALYREQCGSCHGKTTGGTMKGPPLVVYDAEHFDDESFYTAIRKGVKQQHWNFGDMPPVTGLTEEQVRKIIAYVRETQIADERRQRPLDQ